MNIVYLHGFGSSFKPTDGKTMALKELGEVSGFSIDYSMSQKDLIESTLARVGDVDLIVGTSMGGWLASQIGSLTGVPFVAINPALDPAVSLMRTVNMKKDYSGNALNMTEANIKTFTTFAEDGCGLILLDEKDELFNSENTASFLDQYYQVEIFEGGSHRFEHMPQALESIKNFYEMSGIVYGL